MQSYFWDLLRGKSTEDSSNFTEAHMGEENNFYYNEELKTWVVRGEEEQVARAAREAPPPPRPSENGKVTQRPATSDVQIASTTARSLLTSDQLYTRIPGIEVSESKTKAHADPLIPLNAKSQFVPDRANDDDSYDFIN
ncbi:-COPII coat assembly protein sec16 [Babesia bigemina]|uniref:-COPII coat assembly protein sec16 n=1 Tax=Babesia bigemina TaxID=5866 RepID=A0A061DEB1_BABBI|nr:-COPII coat assembly protein sec16 [Babesia bigemina]CDR98119.1 -COPII coat assembly protein sec16 [Babesia bigemina]|eukprot:XP_012770305.1 -COPII coat assembly protein sec16 [Babesia bigemina]